MPLVSFWEQSGSGPNAEPEVDPLEELRQREEELKRQGEEIIRVAQEEAARIHEDAYQKGYAAGEEAGQAAGKKQFDEVCQRFSVLLTTVEQQLAEKNRRYEEELLLLVKTMVDRLVQHEVSTNRRVIQACLKQAMAFVVEKSVVKVHLHPDDFSRIREASLENPALLEGKNRIELMEDGSVAEGGCFLETDFGDVDASLEHGREKLYDAVDLAFRSAFAAEEQAGAEPESPASVVADQGAEQNGQAEPAIADVAEDVEPTASSPSPDAVVD